MAGFLATYMDAGPLSHLSCNRDGSAFTNAERLRQFRECVLPSLRNPYPWPYLLPKARGKVIPFRKTA